MGSIQTKFKNFIESKAFHPPRSRYNENHPRLKILRVNNTKNIATMFYGDASYSPNVILYAHGNATDIGYISDFLQELSQDLNMCICSFDYPGYGLSDGKPSEWDCYVSIFQVYNYLLEVCKFHPQNIIVYGSSIGTGPAVKLASERLLLGCILQSPYTSAVATRSRTCANMMEHSSFLSPDIFVNKHLIKQIRVPLVIIHGTRDEIIPLSHSEQLIQLTNQPSLLISIKGANHNDIETHFKNYILEAFQFILYNKF